jgi:hypothetical protein
MTNIEKPVLRVAHASLTRSDISVFRSWCPVCKEGVLLVTRDPRTLRLAAQDNCVLCGQRVEYTDIEALRAQEGI